MAIQTGHIITYSDVLDHVIDNVLNKCHNVYNTNENELTTLTSLSSLFKDSDGPIDTWTYNYYVYKDRTKKSKYRKDGYTGPGEKRVGTGEIYREGFDIFNNNSVIKWKKTIAQQQIRTQLESNNIKINQKGLIVNAADMYRYVYAILLYLGSNITTYISIYNNSNNNKVLMLLNNALVNVNSISELSNHIINNGAKTMFLTNNYTLNEFTNYYDNLTAFINDKLKTQRKITILKTAGYRSRGGRNATTYNPSSV